MATEPRPRPGIVLVDDHQVVCDALAQLLEEEGLSVWAQAGSREEALACVSEQRPDLMLVDLSLGADDGMALVTELSALGILVAVCSSHEEPEYVRKALAAGARAYITKREATRDLARAVRDVLKGWMLISPRAAEDLPGPFQAGPGMGQGKEASHERSQE
ncbi:MAG: response regulator transcription factor [Candidatus Sumerlaeia bacterium]